MHALGGKHVADGGFLQKLIEKQFGFNLKEHLEVIVAGIVIVTTFPVILKMISNKKKVANSKKVEKVDEIGLDF